MFDLVTVITLSYNSSHIWETIDSVLEQDYPNIEYIISDDASENFDEEGIRQHVCRRKSGVTDFWIYTSPENMGTVKNLNRALKHGHGKYILLLSGDDTFASPDVVSTWVEYFHKHNYLYATSYRAVYDWGSSDPIENLPSQEQVNLIKTREPKELFEAIASANFIVGCTTAYTRLFWEKYGYVDETYVLIDDYPILLRSLRNGEPIGFHDKVTICYHTGGVSCPVNYSPVYKRDSNRIFRREIAPYTSHRLTAWWGFMCWKIKQSNNRSFVLGYRFWKKHPLFLPLFAIRHPMHSLQKIKRAIGK